jgi:hypothetical protein
MAAAKTWDVPIRGEWHRATDLRSLAFGRDGLSLLVVEEETEKMWRLHFPDVHGFRCTAEESAAGVLGSLPERGAFYEVVDSAWLKDLGQGKLEHMMTARHYVICCYDAVVEVAATDHSVEPA